MIDISYNFKVFSVGSVQVTNEMKHIAATISIPNASKVKATVSLFAVGKDFLPILATSFLQFDTSLKSYMVVYEKNAVATPSAKSYTSSIGRRRQADRLIHFESRNVTNNSRFPSRAFEYTGDGFITCVKFTFNVSRF